MFVYDWATASLLQCGIIKQLNANTEPQLSLLNTVIDTRWPEARECHAMKASGITSTLDGGELSVSSHGHSKSVERSTLYTAQSDASWSQRSVAIYKVYNLISFKEVQYYYSPVF